MPSEIIWPEQYIPGTTDNYASNETFVKGLTAARRFCLLSRHELRDLYGIDPFHHKVLFDKVN